MTDPSLTREARSHRDRPAARDRNVALIAALLLVIAMPVGWLPGSTGDVIGMIAFTLFFLGVMAAMILWFVPRERLVGGRRASRTALILGVVSIVVGVVFWTGFPFPVGVGAIALGLSQREAASPQEGRGMATAGAILGAVAIVASFILLLIG